MTNFISGKVLKANKTAKEILKTRWAGRNAEIELKFHHTFNGCQERCDSNASTLWATNEQEKSLVASNDNNQSQCSEHTRTFAIFMQIY